MKRINLAIMAFALMMTLSQCKKQESTTGEVIPITLEVSGNNGSRADVNPNVGTVVFTQGDVVYVSSGGKFVGTLTHNGNTFSGNITNPTVGQPLYFYFLGNKTPNEALTVGSSTQCSVIISDQTESLPVISGGPSNETFTGSGLYTAFFYNKCALVKFDVTSSSTSATCLIGLNNKVTVSFASNGVTYDQENNGLIKFAGGNGEKWTILLPQAALESGEEGSAYSEDGICTGARLAIPAITENDYLSEGITIILEGSGVPEVPEGVINGLFTINADGDQVWFSQGNLQYIGSAGNGDGNNTGAYWKFADNQWDYKGNSQSGSSRMIDRDLFGWGTSGYNHNNACYQPWSTNATNSYYYYAYGLPQCNLYDQSGMADWGYNIISNGGNQENSGWRTLTEDEWTFVFNTRNTAIRYAKARVNGKGGVILLPDNWDQSIYPLNDVNRSDVGFYSNQIIATSWEMYLEANGAVFLPAAGVRVGTSPYDAGSYGYYWSATNFNSGYAYGVSFDNGSTNVSNSFICYDGISVRLVRDAE